MVQITPLPPSLQPDTANNNSHFCNGKCHNTVRNRPSKSAPEFRPVNQLQYRLQINNSPHYSAYFFRHSLQDTLYIHAHGCLNHVLRDNTVCPILYNRLNRTLPASDISLHFAEKNAVTAKIPLTGAMLRYCVTVWAQSPDILISSRHDPPIHVVGVPPDIQYAPEYRPSVVNGFPKFCGIPIPAFGDFYD